MQQNNEIRVLQVEDITQTVAELCIKANKILTDDLKNCMQRAYEVEDNGLPKEIMSDLIDNYKVAEELNIPVCQDTGMTVVFLEIGQDVHITGGDLTEAINKGVAKGYTEGLLRKSVVEDPLRRKNTGDNTPAVIHTAIVPGDKLKITISPKGAGSENMSSHAMMNPTASREDVIDHIVKSMRKAGSNPCPPVVIGIGIGGTFEGSAILAKKALLRDLGSEHSDPYYAKMERDLLEKINQLGIGPQGFGGKTTALAVHIEAYPTHIACLPVAINMGCHANRHATATL